MSIDQTAPNTIPDIHKHVEVPLPVDKAFELFVHQASAWWPAAHNLLRGEERVEVVIEPRPGGRYFDRGAAGTELEWGSVRVFDPPHHLTLSWRIDGRWQPIDDEARASEIDVWFTPIGNARTRVELGHVKLARHGEFAQRIHDALQGSSPGETLASFATVADRIAREQAG